MALLLVPQPCPQLGKPVGHNGEGSVVCSSSGHADFSPQEEDEPSSVGVDVIARGPGDVVHSLETAEHRFASRHLDGATGGDQSSDEFSRRPVVKGAAVRRPKRIVAAFAGHRMDRGALRVAGDELDEDIIQYLRNKYNLFIGPRMAEHAKMTIGSAYHLPQEKTMTVRGRNLITGLPEAIEISSVELREAMSSSVQTIIEVVKDALDEAPPEIIADLMDNGICLAGGGALLQGLGERITNDLHVRAWVAEDPMSCVARGCGISIENMDLWSSLYIGLGRID